MKIIKLIYSNSNYHMNQDEGHKAPSYKINPDVFNRSMYLSGAFVTILILVTT